MLQALDIVSIHITTRVKGKRVRRCKQIIEIIDIDPATKEILTNEVFRWDPVEDKFIYTGKSYVLEGIRARWDLSKEEITDEIRRRAEILTWMARNNIRTFKEVAKVIARYAENPKVFLKEMKEIEEKKKKEREKVRKREEKPLEVEEFTSEKNVVDPGGVNKKKNVNIDEKRKVFKELKSVDESIAVLLYDNGYTSIDALSNASIKDLAKIEGINKKTAKKILKEVIKKNRVVDYKKNVNTGKNENRNRDEGTKEKGINKIDIFKDFKSIDDTVAEQLYRNGIKTLDDLNRISWIDLTEIEGVDKKTAKKIKKEVEKKFKKGLFKLS